MATYTIFVCDGCSAKGDAIDGWVSIEVSKMRGTEIRRQTPFDICARCWDLSGFAAILTKKKEGA